MRPLDLLLGAGCAALVATAAWRIDAALPPPATAVAPPPPPAAGPAAAAPKPLDAYAEALARPVFSPKRRADAAPATAAARDGLHLVGIILDRTRPLALLRTGDAAEGAVVGVGQAVAGFRVRAIGPDRVLLDGDGGPIELRLPEPAESPSPTDLPTRPSR